MSVMPREEVLAQQVKLADANFRLLKESNVRAFNIMGPAGSGKTTVIEKLIERLIYCDLSVGTVATAQSGDTDHQRFVTCGAQSVNVDLGEQAYLDALALSRALSDFDLNAIDVLLVENVPGIISMLDFPLGTTEEIAVLPLTAGNAVIQSYPRIFSQTDLLVINKVDLQSIVNIDPEMLATEYARINPQGRIIRTDARRGNGIDDLVKELGYTCEGRW